MTSLELLRVDFAVYALVRDDNGQVLDEIQIAQGRAFPAQFDSLPGELRNAFEDAQQQHAATQDNQALIDATNANAAAVQAHTDALNATRAEIKRQTDTQTT